MADTEALMASVSAPALAHAGVEPVDVGGIFVGVMNNGFSKQDFQGSLVAMANEPLAHVPAVWLENACATGSGGRLHGHGHSSNPGAAASRSMLSDIVAELNRVRLADD